jgi:23S rRNA (guanosine2251-2'-O)-methyltransferase
LDNVVAGIYEKGETPLLLILDRVTDVRNFGAIARTAECTGVHAIVLPTKEQRKSMLTP